MVTGYFGLPGSGKTTFLTMIAQKELKLISQGKSKYDRVYTNFYCEGCYCLRWEDLGVKLIEDSLILIDEITLFADSRDFKQFPFAIKQFFILHRHYCCDIIYFTQHYNNVDKKIRDLTYDLYFVRPFLHWFSKATRIFRTLDIQEQTHEIVNGYRFSNFFDMLFAGKVVQFCFRPRWYKYFDSYEANRNLPKINLVLWSKVP